MIRWFSLLVALPALAADGPRDKARELLDSPAETSAGAHPDVAATALLRIRRRRA